MNQDIEIARNAVLESIQTIAQRIAISPENLYPYGHDKAKISASLLSSIKNKPDGKLILVTAISPTPAGEGKTTTTIGLHDALCALGKRSLACIREPSLGPCLGMKGGAAGGGHAQVVPMESINLHFTGDFHAITCAHNLLAAALDNHIHWGNKLRIDVRHIQWKRVIDMNDRSLRHLGLGGAAHGVPYSSGFDITAASELMAILCLAQDFDDLRKRISRIVVAYDETGKSIIAADLKVVGAMMVLLKDAFLPNLVQTLEHNPVFIHGGPFANIAHGCNSVIATMAGLKLADYVITEAGFGADLGAEKFFNIKCRQAGLSPDLAVLVATVRALKMHGGVSQENLGAEAVDAVANGCENLLRHIKNIQKFNVPVIVAINRFNGDTEAELNAIRNAVPAGIPVVLCKHWEEGGKGAVGLASVVCEQLQTANQGFSLLYPDGISLIDKIKTIAQEIYGANSIELSSNATKSLNRLTADGYGDMPVCIAKTQYSFSASPKEIGAPVNFTLPIREVSLLAGAGFVVVLCGDIMTMPGLPRHPAAESIDLDDLLQVEGLF